MLLGFKTELKLNSKQRIILAKHAGTARHAFQEVRSRSAEVGSSFEMEIVLQAHYMQVNL